MGIYRKEEGRMVRGVVAALVFAVALFGSKRLADWLTRFDWAARTLASTPAGVMTWAKVLAAVLLVACIVGLWALMNHAKSVDFLVDTESELRKVSWPIDLAQPRFTDRYRELWQSSMVVIASVLIMGVTLHIYNTFLLYTVGWVIGIRA